LNYLSPQTTLGRSCTESNPTHQIVDHEEHFHSTQYLKFTKFFNELLWHFELLSNNNQLCCTKTDFVGLSRSSLSLTLTHTLSLSFTHSPFLSLTHSLSLTLSFTHSHTLSLSNSLFHSLTHTLSLSFRIEDLFKNHFQIFITSVQCSTQT